MSSTLSGIVTSSRLSHIAKAAASMLVKPSEIDSADNCLQELKELLPMLVTLFGKVTLVRAMQPLKA